MDAWSFAFVHCQRVQLSSTARPVGGSVRVLEKGLRHNSTCDRRRGKSGRFCPQVRTFTDPFERNSACCRMRLYLNPLVVGIGRAGFRTQSKGLVPQETGSPLRQPHFWSFMNVFVLESGNRKDWRMTQTGPIRTHDWSKDSWQEMKGREHISRPQMFTITRPGMAASLGGGQPGLAQCPSISSCGCF